VSVLCKVEEMYCPQCLTEYRDGFTDCADCSVPLVAGFPPEPQQGHAVELVTVLVTHDSFALSLARASLDDAGIEYVVRGEDSGQIPGTHGGSGIGTTPLWNASCWVQVSPEFENAAREQLEPLQNPEPAG